MGSWQSGFTQWAPAWAAVRGLSSTRDGDAVKITPARGSAPPQYVATWPGRDTPRAAAAVAGHRGSHLTLVTDDAETAQEFAARQGLAPLSRLALLTAYPSDLPQAPQLPDGAELSLALAGGCSVVEITAFGDTVARGRMAPADGLAVLGGLYIRRADPDHTMESAVVTALTGEAAATEVPMILMPALPKSVPWYGRQGWSPTAAVLTFMRPAGP